jgi:hypothetical protein
VCSLFFHHHFRAYIKSSNSLWTDVLQDKRLGSTFSLLDMEIQFSQHHLLRRLSVLPLIFWAPLSKKMAIAVMNLCQGPLFYPIVLHVCFCASTMLVLLLWLCSVVWRSTPELIFWLRIALATWGLLCFYMNFSIHFSISMKNGIGILIGTALNI